MFIMSRPLTEDFAPFMHSRDAVALMFSQRTEEEAWSPFVDDANELTVMKGKDFSLDNGSMLLLVAKDKDTMVRGLAFAGNTEVHCECGSIVMFRGKYSTGSSFDSDPSVMKKLPSFLGAVVGNFKTGGVHTPSTFVSTKVVRHKKKRRELEGSGYYICLARQGSFNAKNGGVTYVGRKNVTYKAISTLLNNDREVNVQGKFNLMSTDNNLYYKLIDLLSWRAKRKAQKRVQEFEQQQGFRGF